MNHIEHEFGAVEFYDDDLKKLANFLDGTEYPLYIAKETTDRAGELNIDYCNHDYIRDHVFKRVYAHYRDTAVE